MEQIRQIEAIAMDRLIEHPQNPNRMSKGTFNKLLGHIKRTGNYEPIVVRKHPARQGCFEIVNGHHRFKALKELGLTRAECIVWQVNDIETMLLLTTLNRLCGYDILETKSELVRKLSRQFSTKTLARMLPDSSTSIERLKDLCKQTIPSKRETKAFLIPLVFFLTDAQKVIVDKAIDHAKKSVLAGTAAQKKAEAMVNIARAYSKLNDDNIGSIAVGKNEVFKGGAQQ
jgi:ParB/RepB/Spo0J family partition protein